MMNLTGPHAEHPLLFLNLLVEQQVAGGQLSGERGQHDV